MLSAALGLFCEHGYAATSTRRIAEAAGITEGLVFHYFASKEALLLELASRQNMFAGRALFHLKQAASCSARQLLLDIASELTHISAEEAAFIGFMLAEAQINPTLRAPIVAATTVMVEGFVLALKTRVAAGELRKEASLSAAIHGFFGGFLFFFTQHRHLDQATFRTEADLFAKAWADQCWRGLATFESLSSHSINTKETKP